MAGHVVIAHRGKVDILPKELLAEKRKGTMSLLLPFVETGNDLSEQDELLLIATIDAFLKLVGYDFPYSLFFFDDFILEGKIYVSVRIKLTRSQKTKLKDWVNFVAIFDPVLSVEENAQVFYAAYERTCAPKKRKWYFPQGIS